MSARMNECFSGKGATNQLIHSVAIQSLLIWMHWPFVSGAKEPQWHRRWCGLESLNVWIFLLDAVLAFLDCGPISISMYLLSWPSFQHCSYFAGASVKLGLPQYFSCNALTKCVSFTPVLYKCVCLLILAQWRLVLPGNTVLKWLPKLLQMLLILWLACAKNVKYVIPQ